MTTPNEYRYSGAASSHTESYLNQAVFGIVAAESQRNPRLRIFELGCGNGSFASKLAARNYEVVAVDVSTSGIAHAKAAFRGPHFDVASAYDDLASKYGQFDIVVSLEVVEHLYAPRLWAESLRALLLPRGLAIVSTPYHGYLKNLALSVAGRWDSHMNPLWDHGHIKLWSVTTLTALVRETGLHVESVRRIGRLPAFARSMILSARRPR